MPAAARFKNVSLVSVLPAPRVARLTKQSPLTVPRPIAQGSLRRVLEDTLASDDDDDDGSGSGGGGDSARRRPSVTEVKIRQQVRYPGTPQINLPCMSWCVDYGVPGKLSLGSARHCLCLVCSTAFAAKDTAFAFAAVHRSVGWSLRRTRTIQKMALTQHSAPQGAGRVVDAVVL